MMDTKKWQTQTSLDNFWGNGGRSPRDKLGTSRGFTDLAVSCNQNLFTTIQNNILFFLKRSYMNKIKIKGTAVSVKQ